MIKLITYLINQKLLVFLLVFLILLSGLVTLFNLNREVAPEVNFDMVSILTIYAGGSPDELEQLITIPIEKKLREVDGIDKVRSYNLENVSVVVVYIDDRVPDVHTVADDIKDKVALVDDLPESAEKPVVEEIKIDKTPVIDMAIFPGEEDVTYREIREMADYLEDYIYEIDGVAEVEDFGYLDREFLVEVDPDEMKYYRIGMNTLINTLKARNLDVPGGSLRIGSKEYVLRSKGQYRNKYEILNTAIMANDLGFVTRIKDIARVYDTFEEPDVHERVNGQEAVVYRIWKKRSADEIDLVDHIRASMKDLYKEGKFERVKIAMFNDTSRYTRQRISSVLVNAAVGFVLLGAILLILLGPRMSAIVSISIPVAFMVAFIGMDMGDITLNVISLFGMIMVLGMIVDFGIVVSENSHRYMELGINKEEAIKKGVAEVAWPVTVTLLCICAAFAPLLFLSGIMGKFIRGIPVVLMICLVASWVIAIFILPTFLNTFSKENHNEDPGLKKEDIHFEYGFFGRLQRQYKKLLNVSLKHRYITLLVLFVLLLLSLGLVATQQVKFVFMPGGGAEQLEIKATLSQEVNLQANLEEMEKVEDIIVELPREDFDALHTSVGLDASSPLDPKPGEKTYKTTFKIYLTRYKDRVRTAEEIIEKLRKKITMAQEEGVFAQDIFFEYKVEEHGPPIGKPINVEIRGQDFDVIKKISQEYISYLRTIKGVKDITTDLEEGKLEYRYVIDEEKAARAKVSMYDVGMALNASYQGAVATSVKKGDESIDIRVRFPESARKKMTSLNDVRIDNMRGGFIPLDLVTRVKKRPGYSQINRLNYKRIGQVQAEVDTDVITSVEANRLLEEKFDDIEKRYPEYTVDYGGEQEDTDESMGELGVLFIFALLVIYIILAVFFSSLITPVVVMSAIPFSLVGVITALWVHGQPMSFMSTLGVFSLAGVIVSNTLVLVQFINNQRDDGLGLKDALIEGGVIRLRPVLLTSGTTVLALFPTIYGIGGIDHFVAPLALSFGYGLIFATFITLILIPCFYHIAEDLKGLMSRFLGMFGITMGTTIFQAAGSGEVTFERVAEQENSRINEVLKPVTRKEKKKKK